MPARRKKSKKKSTTQKIINNLEDYRQPARQPVRLAEFMSELQISKAKEEDEEPLPVETRRVISVIPDVSQQVSSRASLSLSLLRYFPTIRRW